MVDEHPLPWLAPLLNGVEHANFFETRATEYSKAATRGNWGEVWDSFDKRQSAKAANDGRPPKPGEGGATTCSRGPGWRRSKILANGKHLSERSRPNQGAGSAKPIALSCGIVMPISQIGECRIATGKTYFDHH